MGDARITPTRGDEAKIGRIVTGPGGDTTVQSKERHAFLSARNNAHLCSNCYHDGVNWMRYDTAAAAACLQPLPNGGTGDFYFRTAAAGANPIAWTDTVITQGDLASLLMPSRARVYSSVAIATVSAVMKIIPFDSEEYDIGGLHSNVTNNSRITADATGVWQVGGQIEWTASNVTERRIVIFKNGVMIAEQANQAGSTGYAAQQVYWEGSANATDYFELGALQVTGVGINVTQVAGFSPYMWARRAR